MRTRIVMFCGLVGLAVLLSCSPSDAGELWAGVFGRRRLPPPQPVDRPTPKGFVLAVPPYQLSDDEAHWAGTDGQGVAAFRWGYFGARPQSACTWHAGYYDDFRQWTLRRGN